MTKIHRYADTPAPPPPDVPDLSDFAAVEVQPVLESEGCCCPCPEKPEDATFWTVYGHFRKGRGEGVTALIDCVDDESAAMAAAVLARAIDGEQRIVELEEINRDHQKLNGELRIGLATQ